MDERIEKDAINPNNGNVNNNKTSTFNLIIGIATLLIAILGATFAYFSATARGNENDVTVKSAFVSISYDGGTEIKASNLIPSTIQVALNKFERTDIAAYNPETDGEIITDYDNYESGDVNRRCIDAKGKEVCYVYQFSIKSDSAEEYTDILAYINVNTNEFDNLSYVLYEVDYETQLNDVTGEEEIVTDKYGIGIVKEYSLVSDFQNFDENDYNVDYKGTGFEKFEKPEMLLNPDGSYAGVMNPVACLFGRSDDYATKAKNDSSRCKEYSMKNSVTVGEGGAATREAITHYYQLVIWLNETGAVQEEQGKLFAGTVVIEVSGGLDSADYENGQITGKQ